ncbi:CHASE2 domain-containing protein [Burkholderia stagnalis]|uniref:CHASE2 domain-containing protein n=1 Tax=Burkholderia stagnalis TaxID=1503054 RepID=UPI000F59C3CC|nr:CHASE2 domain-containing protein [Burkholderia stagnalis]RQQ03228.1 CHASE2 domain-containing protein [Burkholderia stagnalis]RQQ19819.1 CHASE2 domain-containing protein [Burkholderia stagnalis]RQQ41125.1 CHASE2 domain-containing protein [Burkholderia stagnalis]RQQ98459.1 CHASE2 domain-containing protein [Burkholderia stagnalis]RQX87969.1 CHASE2 domain-containing protein [Burkholderia stagnalis]
MKPESVSPRRRLGRRFLVEWIAIGCLGIAVIVACVLGRASTSVDGLVYDRLLMLRSLPLSPDIVVVDIDNQSVATLGRWPWPRSVHARLLDALSRAQPAAVVYDVLFTEPSPDDRQFAAGLGRVPTFMPILLSPEGPDGTRTVDPPVPELAARAAGLGHINLEVDPDGIVRSVALYESDGRTRWPQLMVPVFDAIRAGKLHPAGGAPGAGAHDLSRDARGEGRYLIPFNRNTPAYPTLSFDDVLAGRVPPGALRGKIVVVGVTASGLYDRFATPVSGDFGPLAGVYIHAGVLDMLTTGRAISPVSRAGLLAASLLPLAVLLAGFLMLSPRRALLLTLGLAALSVCASAALLYEARLWLSPAPAIFGLIAVYPIWNWRRLEMTMAHLRRELERLADEPHLLPEAPLTRSVGGDVLERQMALMAQAAQRVQDMKRFVWDSLDSMPEPIFVTDLAGTVLIANHAAKRYAARLALPLPEGAPLRAALGELTFVKTVDGNAEHDAAMRQHWPDALDPTLAAEHDAMERGIEVRDRDGLDHLLRYAPCTNAQGRVTGWIAGLVDVTELHAAERHREEALHLLSHDMRSPQSSILALVEIERQRVDSDDVRGLLARIERYAHRALSLADEFVQLARAESQAYQLEATSFVDVLIDASDEVWPQAQAKRIRIDTDVGSEMGWVRADRSLITRAFVNLLNNAVKYSPTDTVITCTLSIEPAAKRMTCTIRDQGYGISPEDQRHLFERFKRFHAGERPEISGSGLGMAFVKTVVTRHGGSVSVDSEVGVGTAVTVALPTIDEPSA